MKYVIKEARNVNEAVSLALKELKTTIDKVDVKILNEGSTGFLGLFGKKDATVKVYPKFDAISSIETLVSSYLKSMTVNSKVEVIKQSDSHVLVDIKDDGLGYLIGKHGNTLNALEHLVNLAINRQSPYHLYITLNVGNYLQTRRETLQRLAQNIAVKVKQTKTTYIFEPMKSQERKIIHAALQNTKNIKTSSIGEEPDRKVAVEYVES
ncbi:MAG TPA: hypothetical protein DCP90_00315 [Clostridiales bacterium]|nr:MAG: hypothetical protein A2Y22_04515 [Clostridiales bacterium GWD2_32_59]HAN09039.1 hypothetical protein [Clostridiales bacterium]